MLKKHMAACLMATAFMAAPALAQTTTAPAGSQTAPATQSQMSTGSSAAMSGKFLTMLENDQLRGSKLVGVAIYGSDNERIGDVNEIILDRQGKVEAVVIGVGGFLGIGEKNVAVPFETVQWQWDSDASTTASTRGTNDATANRNTTAGTATTGSTGSTAGQSGMAANQSGVSRTDNTGSTAAARANREGAPERGVLRMSKADLQNAPRFAYNPDDARSNQGDTNRNTTAPAGNTAPSGATNQPRQ